MACELLLLGSEEDGFPLLIVEEPEAHLHPQRQLRLVQFLQDRVKAKRSDGQSVQIILTTHSPNLASSINLENLVLVQGGRAFPLPRKKTLLDNSDYSFLQRFLDVTKANLFFARGVLIVEGDAENILLPTLARLIERDLTNHGVSIVNVGTTGLGRFGRIYQRANPENDGQIDVPVACVADLDVMPDCAPEIIGKVEPGAAWPEGRRWRAVADFNEQSLAERREAIRQRASGQRVETFVSDHWTLEYDLARCGLAKEMWLAVQLAAADERLSKGTKSAFDITKEALKSWKELEAEELTSEQRASRTYAPLAKDNSNVSKPITAQYLAKILELEGTHARTPNEWRAALPPYIVSAIDYVTSPTIQVEPEADDDHA